jgi:DNA-binding transcriptional MerR regulator
MQPQEPRTVFFLTTDVARQAGVSASAIRLWEREGRIETAQRTAGGVRLFTEQALLQAKQLRAQRGPEK